MIKLSFPFTKEKILGLKVGDEVLISGVIHTGRDAVHKYLHEGGALPPDLVGRARLGCICVLEESASAAGIRYLIRKWEKLYPGVPMVVGLWHASVSSPLLAQIRAESVGHVIVTSISELTALWRASNQIRG